MQRNDCLCATDHVPTGSVTQRSNSECLFNFGVAPPVSSTQWTGATAQCREIRPDQHNQHAQKPLGTVTNSAIAQALNHPDDGLWVAHRGERPETDDIVKNARKSRTWQWASGHIRSRSEGCIWRVLGGQRKFKKIARFSFPLLLKRKEYFTNPSCIPHWERKTSPRSIARVNRIGLQPFLRTR